MARQARNYLAGAVSGTALVGAAVVAFVMLVSLQSLRDWPLAGLLGGSDPGGAAASKPAGAVEAGAGAGEGGARATLKGTAAAGHRVHGARPDGRQAGIDTPGSAGSRSPAAQSPTGGNAGSSPGSAPSGSSPSGSAAGSASGGASGSPSSPGGGAKSGGGSSPSGTVTHGVDETVSGADEATGGALGGTGVTKVTEETVEGVAGPESPLGETVDRAAEKVGEAVGGLLPGAD